jgi:flagellar hook-associated protein 2
MAGSVTFAGVGSGIDVNALVEGLTAIEAKPISAEKSHAASLRGASSSLSGVGSLLAKLRTATAALASAQQVNSFTASASSTDVAVSASGSAQAGSYDVTVQRLAQEQRTYSNSLSTSSGAALGLAGPLKIGVGTGTQATIDVTAGDTVNTLVDKINGAGIRASASVFFDGTSYRLQVRGLDSGDANYLTFDESAVPLGLTTPANTKQAAQNALVDIDGFQVSSATNQVTGAIQGVTLAVTAKSVSPTHVTIASDPDSLGDKLKAVADAYNAVIGQIHTLAGHGQTAASNPALAGDSALRAISGQLSSALSGAVGTGKYRTLGSLGLNLQNDGTLLLDRSKLTTAVQTDPTSVALVIAGTSNGTSGIMDVLGSLVDKITDPRAGSLQTRADSLSTRAKSLDDQIARQQARVAAYTVQLQKQFAAMDTTVSHYQSLLSQLNIKA